MSRSQNLFSQGPLLYMVGKEGIVRLGMALR